MPGTLERDPGVFIHPLALVAAAAALALHGGAPEHAHGAPQVQQAHAGEPDYAALAGRARAALGRCDFSAAEAAASGARRLVPEGSDAYLEATSLLVRALYEQGALEELVTLARRATALVWERDQEGPLRATLGGVHPVARDWSALIAIHAAYSLQARGEHEGALYFLREVLDGIRAGRYARGSELMPMAGLAAGRSLLATGRLGEARQALGSLRENFPSTLEAGVASVLLQRGPNALGEYRGRYEGDPRFAARARALEQALPGARARLGAALGVDPEALERIPVGIADAPAATGHSMAITVGDPRLPEFPPVVVVFSQFLVQGLLDLEPLLVHELAHAHLIGELGIAYERLPGWAVEGISQAVAGEWPLLADTLLGRALLEDPERFLRSGSSVSESIDFVGDPCGGPFDPTAGFALWPLAEVAGLAGVRGFVAELLGGSDPYQAHAGRSAVPPDSLLEWAHGWLSRRLEMLREPLLPALERLLAAREQGDAEVVARADAILAADSGRILRGFALWQRATALERIGRHAAALESFEELLAVPHELPIYQEGARMGRIRGLAALGQPERARRELLDLRRDAILSAVSEWVEEQLGPPEDARRR